MGFSAPLYFLFSVFLLLVIFMYFFRKQYETKNIPSVLLWQEWMNEFEAQAWWRKLQHHLLLYLQLLALCFLIVTLAQPFYNKDGLKGDHIIFIMDTSASMTAKEGEVTRLELAKKEAKEILAKVNDQHITVIHASETPEILIERSTSSKEVQNYVTDLNPTYGGANLLDSIEMAKNLLGDEEGQIHLFTDFLSKDTALDFHENTTFIAYNIGESNENLAIDTFGVGTRDNNVIGVVTIKNEGKALKGVELTIQDGDGNSLETIVDQLEAENTKTFYIEGLPLASVYKAILVTDDHYEVDNEQYAFLSSDHAASIYIHNDVHPFVRKAAEIAGEDVIHLTKDEGNNENLAGIHVLKGMPDEEWPKGPKLIFLSQNENQENVTGDITYNQSSPLFQSVELEKVHIESAISTELFEGLEVVAKSGETPLILSGMFEGTPTIIVLFDLSVSDWPLHTGFPLFIYHAIQYLSEKEALLGYYYPGQFLDIIPGTNTQKYEIINNSNNVVSIIQNLDEPIKVPFKPGLYTFKEYQESEEIERKLYVMLPDNEKTIQTEEAFTISTEGSKEGTTNAMSKKEFSHLFILLGFIVLLIEWEVYRRGISN
ncbi:vWA domain-containing protein [Sutcliffiella rhizosphaerae]|nr:VWA domain-containing protein [Sutcliffiella rhizosphaerae]